MGGRAGDDRRSGAQQAARIAASGWSWSPSAWGFPRAGGMGCGHVNRSCLAAGYDGLPCVNGYNNTLEEATRVC